MFISTAYVNAPWMTMTERVNITSELRDTINEKDKIKTLANKTQDDVMLSRYKVLTTE